MNLPVVRSATEADRRPVVDVITLAFVSDPLVRWAIPNAAAYLSSCPPFIEAFGCNGLPHGTTYVVGDFAGVAMWLAPGVEPDVERMGALMEEYLPVETKGDFAAVFDRMGDYHPHEPHWYLPLIGVDPAQHGRGYGAALMRHAVQRFDGEGAVAYLESSNPRNISLYERHGFEVLGTIQIGKSPPVTPMVRKPR